MPSLPNSTPKLQQLQMQIDALPPGEILRFPAIDQDMLLVAGVLVQTYSYIELNFRRCVEIFAHAKLLGAPWARNPTTIQSARLVEVVKDALIRIVPKPSELPDWNGKLDEIALRWSMRHMFAHWALRRVPREDYIILMTNDGREVKRLHKLSHGRHPPMLAVGQLTYALMNAADARGVCEHMVLYEKWIAQKTADWFQQYVGP
jgi:hypothetical protein